jgi:hypothetical protein
VLKPPGGFPHPQKPGAALMPRRVLRGNCARSIDSDPRKATMPPAAISVLMLTDEHVKGNTNGHLHDLSC